MMQIYTVYDKKTELFNSPFFQRSHQAAIRAMRTEVNRQDENNNLYLYPQDYELHHIGEFDDTSGVIKPEGAPRLIVDCKSLVNEKVQK